MKSLSSGRSKRRLELHFGGDVTCPEPHRPRGTHAAPLGRRAPRCACQPRGGRRLGRCAPTLARGPGATCPSSGARGAVGRPRAGAKQPGAGFPPTPTRPRVAYNRAQLPRPRPVTVSSVSTPACPPLVSARLHQARASSHTPFLPSRVYHARFPAAQIPPPARCLLQCPEDGPRHPGGPGARSPARVPVTPARVPRPTSGLTRSPRPRKAARRRRSELVAVLSGARC